MLKAVGVVFVVVIVLLPYPVFVILALVWETVVFKHVSFDKNSPLRDGLYRRRVALMVPSLFGVSVHSPFYLLFVSSTVTDYLFRFLRLLRHRRPIRRLGSIKRTTIKMTDNINNLKNQTRAALLLAVAARL